MNKKTLKRWIWALVILAVIVFLLGYPFQFRLEHFSFEIAVRYWLAKVFCLIHDAKICA